MDIAVPKYWKDRLEDADEVVKEIKNGEVEEFVSTGGRKIYRITYGRKNQWNRTANYCSAGGAHSLSYYADKTRPGVRPTLFLVGGIHGFEFEGTVALLNLIHIFETGLDFAGNPNPTLSHMPEDCNFVIIPYANPDGRARVPFHAAEGITFEEFRYYAQGTWADGSLCGWPECKSLHPVRGDKVGHLGAYYTDDGINLMHDIPFSEAEETKLVLKTADEFVPELTLLLHGGTNTAQLLMSPNGVHFYFKKQAKLFSEQLAKRCAEEGLELRVPEPKYGDDEPLHEFNLASAITNACGELALTYESNQGLNHRGVRLTLDEIYRHHMLLFEEGYRYVCQSLVDRAKGAE